MISAADFREIVRTVQQEYAGAEELQNPELGQVFSSVIGMMDEMHLLEENMLYNLTQVYLTAQGLHKVRFTVNSKSGLACTRGFTARGSGEGLWVTDTARENRLRPGDRILSLNGDAPAVYRARLSQRTAPVPISDRDRWEPFLNYADHIEVQHTDGTIEKVKLRRFPAEENQPVRELKQLDRGVLYARADLVDDSEETAAFMAEYKEKAATAGTVILDLRRQRGEGLENYRAFVETVITGTMTAERFWGKKDLLVRYSETNTDRLTESLQRMRSELPDDPEVTAYLNAMLADLKTKRGSGLIPEPDEGTDEAPYHSASTPERVILLLDAETADDAEWFAERAARFDHVTLLGRETSGDTRYDYPAVLHFFKGTEMTYPIAKTAEVPQAGPRRGVMPQIGIPWTAEETMTDIILGRALTLVDRALKL